MENILRRWRASNTPTVAASDEEIIPEPDEPPDEKVPEMDKVFKKESLVQRKGSAPGMPRRESLLTRSLLGRGDEPPTSPRLPYIPRGMSTTSSHSFASTAELTSDAESLLRSASPSPPLPSKFNLLDPASRDSKDTAVNIAPLVADDKNDVEVTGEAALEKTLGRKRRIMFACIAGTPEPVVQASPTIKPSEQASVAPAPRKTRISFACPARPAPPKPSPRTRPKVDPHDKSPSGHGRNDTAAQPVSVAAQPAVKSKQYPFHEFASSHDEMEDWVHDMPPTNKPKLTINDCLKKENAIRKLGAEAEEEAEEEEREQQEMQNDLDESDADEDDFAPSDNDDDTQIDDGNETDNEEGFAESDSESDAGSEYQFWAPSTTSTRATSTDNMTHFSARQASRSRASSTSSTRSCVRSPSPVLVSKNKASKAIRLRPGTPELPDSTDFVCGTLDEDRPLEAAYISCREQRRQAKHIPIPQDIDPSFPTSDPEDEDDADDLAESSDQVWIKDQFEAFHEEVRHQKANKKLISPSHTPPPAIAPPRTSRPVLGARPTRRSPPPKGIARSPAPHRGLFDHAPRRVKFSGPYGRLRSPPGSPTSSKPTPFGITINHLAQRPNAEKTSSLPHTPNPFFRNWRNGSQPVSRISSGHVTPGVEDSNPDLHVRGPVDIVIGLEKKRQKRKEKYWRQNCRKAAREQAERRPPPGRGAERMKELGLECAERTRGYGLGQQAQLVLSL